MFGVRVASGEDRIAFIGKEHTVKVAKSHPIRFAKQVGQTLFSHGPKELIHHWRAFDADSFTSLKNQLFHGVVANKRERRLAKNFGQIVTPTVSLLGLVNVQNTAQTTGLTSNEIHEGFVNHLGPAITRLGHMLEEPSNIGMSEGTVKFVDGGSRHLEEMLDSRYFDISLSLGYLAMQRELAA